MKSLIVILGLLAVINLTTCRQNATSAYIRYLKAEENLDKLHRNFAQVCPGKDDELDSALVKVQNCIEKIDEYHETACSVMRKYFLKCTKPVVDLMDTCLPEQSDGIPSLIFESINSGIAYLCQTNGEHLFELTNDCFFSIDYESMRCERRVQAKLQQYRNQAPTKTELCKAAHSLRPCYVEHLADRCGNTITRESFIGLFDALATPCKNVAGTL